MNRVAIERALAGLGRPNVLVLGDLILDRYVSGEVARISPEAPIPILAAKHTEQRLGGAGNVAWNLSKMEAGVEVIGVVGDDGYGRALSEMLAELGTPPGGCVVDASQPTIRKTRLLSGVQQMLRVDWEDPSPIAGETLARVRDLVRAAVPRSQAVVLSDYGKGLLTAEVLREAIDHARAAGIPVLVDPKGNDYTRYTGATLVTPNRKEAEQAVGRKLKDLADVEEAAAELIRVANLDACVITLGADGMYFRAADGTGGRVAAEARAVFDVTGAGDTVVSQLALALGAGLDLATAVELANQAAAIVVGRLGTYAVSREELSARLRETPSEGKVLHGSGDVDAAVAAWKAEGKRVAMTNGCFDILHAGHVDYLRFAASKGDVLIVAVNDDESVRRLKGPERPVNSIADRMEVLAALEMVDAVVAFGEDTPLRVIEQVTPHALIKGEDWADKGVVGREWVEAHGGQVHLAPLLQGRSTTNVIQRARGLEPAERDEA